MTTLALNTGTYFGNGSTNSYGYRTGSAGRVASSTKLNRIAKDVSAGYASQIGAIEGYLAAGKTDKAIDLYNKLLLEIAVTADGYGYELTDGQKESILTTAFKYTTDETFEGNIQSSTSSAFVTGLKEGLPVVGLFVESTSSEEALAKDAGIEPDLKDKVKEAAGALASGAASGAAIGTALGGWSFGIGTAIGAIVGGGIGIARTFFE